MYLNGWRDKVITELDLGIKKFISPFTISQTFLLGTREVPKNTCSIVILLSMKRICKIEISLKCLNQILKGMEKCTSVR